jgi:hypothetical protein
MNKKILLPVVKFRSPETHPDKSHAVPAIIVKMQDFLRENGQLNMSAIQNIRDAGGLHKYLKGAGHIILSPIMPDRLLLKIDYQIYVSLIEELGPDRYITPDGITYNGFIKYSRNQIELILDITSKLLDRFPEYTPIGLVKGCDLSQMDFHLDNLLERGITQICLHAGDFLYKESGYSSDRIVGFTRYIREKVPYMMVYGVGSKHYFRRFHYADVYVTNSHYMQAFNHKRIQGTKWVNFKGKPTKEIVMKNFDYLRRLAEGQCDNRDLTEWVPNTPVITMAEPIPNNTVIKTRILKIPGV